MKEKTLKITDNNKKNAIFLKYLFFFKFFLNKSKVDPNVHCHQDVLILDV